MTLEKYTTCFIGSRYDCDACEFQCLNPEELKEHISKIHEIVVTFGCDQCAFKCLTEVELRAHIETLHRTPEFACHKCDIKLPTEEYLKLHIVREHEKFQCAECNYVCGTEEDLMQHKATNHEPEGYPCDLSNHQDRSRNTYYEEKMAKHPYLHINGQEYDQATLSGLLPSPFRSSIPGTNISVPGAYPTYSITNTGSISYGGVPVPSTISVPGFPIPGSLTNSGNANALVRGGYPWTTGFNMNPGSY